MVPIEVESIRRSEVYKYLVKYLRLIFLIILALSHGDCDRSAKKCRRLDCWTTETTELYINQWIYSIEKIPLNLDSFTKRAQTEMKYGRIDRTSVNEFVSEIKVCKRAKDRKVSRVFFLIQCILGGKGTSENFPQKVLRIVNCFEFEEEFPSAFGIVDKSVMLLLHSWVSKSKWFIIERLPSQINIFVNIICTQSYIYIYIYYTYKNENELYDV